MHLLFCMMILQMWCMSCCSWASCLRTPEQMAHRVAVCNELYTWFQGEGEAEFHDLITVEVLDVLLQPRIRATEFTIENFNISCSKRKIKVVCSAGKVMIIFFLMKRLFYISTLYIKATPSVLLRSLAKNDHPLKKTLLQEG